MLPRLTVISEWYKQLYMFACYVFCLGSFNRSDNTPLEDVHNKFVTCSNYCLLSFVSNVQYDWCTSDEEVAREADNKNFARALYIRGEVG